MSCQVTASFDSFFDPILLYNRVNFMLKLQCDCVGNNSQMEISKRTNIPVVNVA